MFVLLYSVCNTAMLFVVVWRRLAVEREHYSGTPCHSAHLLISPEPKPEDPYDARSDQTAWEFKRRGSHMDLGFFCFWVRLEL